MEAVGVISMCKISIIVPVFNVGGYLERCLNSIKNQTFKDYEVIIVDDGSSDETAEICDKFINQDLRFKVIHKKNEGVSIARNTAIEKACGEYFVFFDGDDYIRPECLEKTYNLAIKEKADGVIYGYYLEEDKKIIETHPPVFGEDIYKGDEVKEKIVPKFIGYSCDDVRRWINGEKDAFNKENSGPWHYMLRASIIKENNILFDKTLKVGEDTCFSTEFFSLAKKVCVIHECFYHLVVRSTSTIYVYEKDPIAIVNGKIALLNGRRNLTNRILSRSGYNIEKLWYGSVIMSIPQLALQLTKNKKLSLKERYNEYKKYINHSETQKIIKDFPDDNLRGKKKILISLLKHRGGALIFLGSLMVSILPVDIKR